MNDLIDQLKSLVAEWETESEKQRKELKEWHNHCCTIDQHVEEVNSIIKKHKTKDTQ